VGERAAQLRERFPASQMPSAAAAALLPFFAYADRCFEPADRLLLPEFLPEVYVWARRPAAGGQLWYQGGFVGSADDRALVMRRLHEQRVVAAVVAWPEYQDVAREFPELDAFIRSRMTTVASLPLVGASRLDVMTDLRLAAGRDAETGWPCFR
jgi:hypothetical protein